MNITDTLTYSALKILFLNIKDFLITLGNMGKDFSRAVYYILKFRINFGATVEQSSRFAFDSLPITLTIVGMTSTIIAMQIAPELAKQGAEGYIGMLSGIVMVRELACIMSGFAVISMIGSSFASELASMAVSEQISAMRVLKTDPIEYLFVPRFLAGVLMMPFVFILSSFIGLVCAAVVSNMTAGLSLLNFLSSLWQGLNTRDIFIAMLKASFFGGTISLISCSSGYSTRGGAKEVGISTTKAVVWSFLAIAVWDYVFAVLFYL